MFAGNVWGAWRAVCGPRAGRCPGTRIIASKILGVNFINVKRTNFSYKLWFSSYVLALSKNSYKKFARLMLMKLTVGLIFTLLKAKFSKMIALEIFFDLIWVLFRLSTIWFTCVK